VSVKSTIINLKFKPFIYHVKNGGCLNSSFPCLVKLLTFVNKAASRFKKECQEYELKFSSQIIIQLLGVEVAQNLALAKIYPTRISKFDWLRKNRVRTRIFHPNLKS